MAKAINNSKKSSASKTSKPAKKKLPITKKMETRINLNIIRLKAVSEKIGKWKKDHGIGKAAALVAESLEQLHQAAELLANVPDEFIPYSFSGGSKLPVQVGSVVRITDRRLEEYSDVLKTDEQKDLVVMEERGKRYLVHAKASDTKFLINKSHLMVQEEVQASAN